MPAPAALRSKVGTPAINVSAVVLCAMLWVPHGIAAPMAGDAYVYRVTNGYNREIVGFLRHEVTSATTTRGTVVSVTTEQNALGLPRTEILTTVGQWLRRPLDNHGAPVEYAFSPALPVVPPAVEGKTWSIRVHAEAAGDSRARSVRVDGEVLGHEKITVPAGTFDTVKIRRTIYPGDTEYFRTETQITEVDWYAPALGRSVRTDTRSRWRQPGCRLGNCEYRGDWHVLELTEVVTAKH